MIDESKFDPNNIPEGYTKCVTKMLYAGIAWIRKNGLTGLEFRLPPQEIGLVGALPVLIPRLARTDPARRFLRALEAAAPREATAMQAICVVGMLELPYTEWTESEMADLVSRAAGRGSA